MAQLKDLVVNGKSRLLDDLRVNSDIIGSRLIKDGGTNELILLADGSTVNISDISGKGHRYGELTDSLAEGVNDASFGLLAIASGVRSHAEGISTLTSGTASHAEGYTTTASGLAAHAEGRMTFASSTASHAEGYTTTASGLAAHAEGEQTKATYEATHAEGYKTDAHASFSHVEGHTTITYGNCSHAEGLHTITTNIAEHAEGLYNVSNDYEDYGIGTIHSIGIGSDENNRENAVEILSNGLIYINGIGLYDGIYPYSAKSLQTVINNIASSINKKYSELSLNEVEYILGILQQLPYYIDYIYIDDFPDPEDWEDWGYSSLQEYLDDVINDPHTAENYGTNIFCPTLWTIEYEGSTYNIWRGYIGTNLRSLEFYGFMQLNITYDELYNMSMEADIDNIECPFEAIVYGGDPDDDSATTYTTNLGSRYTLMYVHKIMHTKNPLPTQSTFDTLYIDNFYDYGLYPAMQEYGVDNISDYISEVIANEGNEYYYDTGETITYEGETCRIFMDNSDYGGFVPANKTFAELYADSLEADSHNITRFTTPFVTLCTPDSEPWYEGDGSKHKHSTLIAVR